MKTPYIGFSNESLRSLPRLNAGDVIDCPKCKGRHIVEDSTPSRRTNPTQPRQLGHLQFYRCGEEIFLAAIDGRNIMGQKADVSGNMEDPNPGDS